jgi:hypothetical protein
LGLDVVNGSAVQLQTYVNTTTISFPILMNASSYNADGMYTGYSCIIDQKGVVQYLEYGVAPATILEKIKHLQALSIRQTASRAQNRVRCHLYRSSQGKLYFWLALDWQEEVSIAMYNGRGQAIYGPVRRSFSGGPHQIFLNKFQSGAGVRYVVIKGATFEYVSRDLEIP